MLRSTVFAALVAAFGILASGPVAAQTSDGQTPAIEGICDDLHGGTPGLFGLCVAYCEAQDLNEMFQQAKAGGVPGEKILTRYRSKMQAGDPDMPCIVSASACPCFNINACDPTRFSCGLNIFNVSELFAGQSCDLEDTCNNTAVLAEDFCTSSNFGRTSADVVALGPIGLCRAATPNGAGGTIGNFTGFILDGPTAQLCLDELNAYDGNGPTDGFVAQCMLGN